MSEFDEYIVHGEPGQREKADAWQTAIGLQDVDGLKVSPYLLSTARQHIEGDITIDEVRERIKVYYETKGSHDESDEEGDKASYKGLKVSPTTEFVERFLRNVILGENNELRNRDMLVGAALPPATVQSATEDSSKCKICTLNCTLEETAVLRSIESNPRITQKEMASQIKKSERTVKTITSSLVEKGILVRRNGRRNGWWEIIATNLLNNDIE